MLVLPADMQGRDGGCRLLALVRALLATWSSSPMNCTPRTYLERPLNERTHLPSSSRWRCRVPLAAM